MLCEHARKATTVVPKEYRHLSKVSKQCLTRTVRHPKVIKGARHVPGPIRELTSLILHDHGPCTAPLTSQVLSLGLHTGLTVSRRRDSCEESVTRLLSFTMGSGIESLHCQSP